MMDTRQTWDLIKNSAEELILMALAAAGVDPPAKVDSEGWATFSNPRKIPPQKTPSLRVLMRGEQAGAFKDLATGEQGAGIKELLVFYNICASESDAFNWLRDRVSGNLVLPTAVPQTTVEQRELDALATHYSLTWDEFEAAGATVEKHHGEWWVAYPTITDVGTRRVKIKSLKRYHEGRGVKWPAGKRHTKWLPTDEDKGTFRCWPVNAMVRCTTQGWQIEPEAVAVVTAGEEKGLVLERAFKDMLHVYVFSLCDGENGNIGNLVKHLHKSGFKRVVGAFDNDQAGEAATDKLLACSRVTGIEYAQTVIWPEGLPKGYDVNDVYRDYTASCLRGFILDRSGNRKIDRNVGRKRVVNAHPINLLPKESKDGKEKMQAMYVAAPPQDIMRQLKEAIGEWPKAVGGGRQLFVIDRVIKNEGMVEEPKEEDIRFINSVPDFFGSLQEHADVHWLDSRSGTARHPIDGTPVTISDRASFFSSVSAAAEKYDSVAIYPHEPKFPGTYYMPWDIEGAAAKCEMGLQDLLPMFNAATEMDRMLLLVLMLTLMWGGESPQRGIFMIRAQTKGSGKTSTADLIGSLFGGDIRGIDIRDNKDTFWRPFFQPENLTKRMVYFDNAQGNLNNNNLTILSTARQIGGHQMYVGNTQRPNNVTVVISANGKVSISGDLSQRIVPIDLAKPNRTVDFQGDIHAKVLRSRARILLELKRILERKEKTKIDPRWGARFTNWALNVVGSIRPVTYKEEQFICEERDKKGLMRPVMLKTIGPNEIIRAIMWRQQESDVDRAGAQSLLAKIQNECRLQGINVDDPTSAVDIIPVYIPLQRMIDFVEDIKAEKGITTKRLKTILVEWCSVPGGGLEDSLRIVEGNIDVDWSQQGRSMYTKIPTTSADHFGMDSAYVFTPEKCDPRAIKNKHQTYLCKPGKRGWNKQEQQGDLYEGKDHWE